MRPLHALSLSLSLTAALVCVACGGDDPAPAGPAPSPEADGGGADGSLPDAAPPKDPTPGCGGSGQPKGLLADQKITALGVERTFSLHVPDGYDAARAWPVVFVFHGDGGTATSMRAYYKIEDAAAGGAIFVYPDGLGRTWDLDGKANVNKDIQLFDAALADVQNRYCVDKAKVFVTGWSSGGYFANQLGCKRGGAIRALATHAGGGPYGDNDEYDQNGDLICAGKPVATIIFHGTSDGSVSLSEGKKSLAHWRKANGCGTGTTPYAPSPCVKYDGCDADRPVAYCEIPGQNHGIWDQGAATAWAFFKAF